MQLADLCITNFRGVRAGYIRFRQHTVFVGPNNCGKTTIIEALALLFGRDRLVRTLTEHDFYGGDPQPADRIHLIATITDFAGDDPAEHVDWFRDGRGVPKWLNPDTGTVHPERQNPTWRSACQIAFAARFDRPSLEVLTARYFHDDDAIGDVFDEEIWTPVPATLIRDIGLFLIPANRTWDRIISFGSELFRRVVASGDGPPAEAVLGERDRLRRPAQALEADPNLNEIVGELNDELAGFFQSRPTLRLRLTSTDSEGVLEAVVPHYAHAPDGYAVPARRQGSGLISLQGLLLLLQFGRRRAAAGEGFWIALEEPELHVPPALQRRLVHRLQALSTQTFVSTHSPMVAAMSDPRALAMLRNEAGALSCTPLQAEVLPATTPNAIRKLFQLNRVDTIAALMHDVVLVPEGPIDVDLLRVLLRAIDAQQSWTTKEECRFAAHVGLVATHDAAVVATYESLSALHPRVACLVDGDQDGIQYANRLVALRKPPRLVLRWPDAWTVEDVVGWIAEADTFAVLNSLATTIAPAPELLVDLVSRLKSRTRDAHGLKQDMVAYEAVAEAVSGSALCVSRARDLMNAMTDALLGHAAARFLSRSGDSPLIRMFQP